MKAITTSTMHNVATPLVTEFLSETTPQPMAQTTPLTTTEITTQRTTQSPTPTTESTTQTTRDVNTNNITDTSSHPNTLQPTTTATTSQSTFSFFPNAANRHHKTTNTKYCHIDGTSYLNYIRLVYDLNTHVCHMVHEENTLTFCIS